MRETRLTLPELALIAGTRAALGGGLGLLLGDRLPAGERRTLGWGLLLTGLISTVPLAIEVSGKSRPVAAIVRPAERGGGGTGSRPSATRQSHKRR